MELTKNIIEDVLKDFAKKGIIFSNEAQFQFDLAWALQNYYDQKTKEKLIKDNNGDKIFFEYKTAIDNKGKNNKEEIIYIDLVVRIDGCYYPIELKYRTADKEVTYKKGNIECTTSLQGAYDEASMGYINDIKRLEGIIKDTQNWKTGFAVLISNEPKIWGDGVKNIDKYSWKEYALFTKGEKGNEPKRLFQNKYSLEWKDYIKMKKNESWELENGFFEIHENRAKKKHPLKLLITEIPLNVK